MTVAIFASCVSSKKYNEAVNAGKASEQAYASLSKEADRLRTDISKLKESSSEALQAKQKQLDEQQKQLQYKEKALAENEKTMQELRELMNAERNAIQNLKAEVCEALKCYTPEELTVEMRDGKLYVSMSDKLLFPSGSDAVNTRGKEAVNMLAAVLLNSNMEIMVEGHTDDVPISSERNRDNWDLSAHRATSVARIMIDHGIKPDRIISSGRGEYHPIALNTSPEGRQKNRRTEIVLAPKLDKLWKLTEGTPTSSVK